MEKERRWQICGNNLKGGRKREIYLVIPRRNFGYFPAVWLISRLAVHFPTRFWLIPPPPPWLISCLILWLMTRLMLDVRKRTQRLKTKHCENRATKLQLRVFHEAPNFAASVGNPLTLVGCGGLSIPWLEKPWCATREGTFFSKRISSPGQRGKCVARTPDKYA